MSFTVTFPLYSKSDLDYLTVICHLPTCRLLLQLWDDIPRLCNETIISALICGFPDPLHQALLPNLVAAIVNKNKQKKTSRLSHFDSDTSRKKSFRFNSRTNGELSRILPDGALSISLFLLQSPRQTRRTSPDLITCVHSHNPPYHHLKGEFSIHGLDALQAVIFSHFLRRQSDSFVTKREKNSKCYEAILCTAASQRYVNNRTTSAGRVEVQPGKNSAALVIHSQTNGSISACKLNSPV